MGKTKIYKRENLIGPFLVHKLLSPRPPHPSSLLLLARVVTRPSTYLRVTRKSESCHTFAAVRAIRLPHPKRPQSGKRTGRRGSCALATLCNPPASVPGGPPARSLPCRRCLALCCLSQEISGCLSIRAPRGDAAWCPRARSSPPQVLAPSLGRAVRGPVAVASAGSHIGSNRSGLHSQANT